MPPPTNCPACGGKLPPYVEACPFCPWSYQEEGVVPYHKRRGRDFSGPLWFVGAIVAIGAVAWFSLNHVIEFAGRDGSSRSVETLRAAAGDKNDKSGKMVVDARNVAKAPAEPEPVIMIAQESGRLERPAKRRRRAEWRLRGAVYDMVTLKPVVGATIILKDVELNRRIETTTDGEGRYKASVAPLTGRGYVVSFDDPNYASGAFIDPGNDALRGKPRVERERLAQELARSVMAPQSLQADDDAPLITNFYLAPKSLR
jgi:hypothetical protein